jgi:hypothetical protein
VLFAYSRPDHLSRTLECLAADKVPLIHAFCDGAKTPELIPRVSLVRQVLRSIDWCEVVMHERQENLGLGRSVRRGVTEILKEYDSIIVFEDDCICVPGTYEYLSTALRQYSDEAKVMSVTGWTHPRGTPANVGNQPYFDGRAECLVWGTWARSWDGMDQEAMTLVRQCRTKGIDVCRYGADLIEMAEVELKQNIWAVRWLYLHMLREGLCLRPPHSLVEHIGFDELATNACDGSEWSNPPLKPCPPLPDRWPVPEENLECARLWQAAYGAKSEHRFLKKARSVASKIKRKLLS